MVELRFTMSMIHMQVFRPLLLVAATVGISGLSLVQASAVDNSRMDAQTTIANAALPSYELSSAEKKKRKKAVRVAPSDMPARATFGWRGADPSFGPDGRPYPNPYPPGRCAVDLGYGRWESCDSE